MQRTLLAAVLLAGFLAGIVGVSILVFRGAGSADPLSAIPSGAAAVVAIPSLPDLLRGLSRARAPGAREGGDWDLAASLVAEITDARGLAIRPEGPGMARVLRGGVAIGILPATRPGGSGDLVVAAELGSRDDALLTWFESSIVPTLAGGTATSTRRAHRGREYVVVKAPGAGVHLCLAGVGRLAIATTTRPAMEASLSALSGQDPSVTSSAAFRAVRREMGRHAELLAYLTKPFVEGIVRRPAAGPARPGPDWRRAMATVSIDAAAVSVHVDADGLFREQARVWIPEMSGTLAGRLFGGRPRPLHVAAELPEGYALYAGATFEHVEAIADRLPSWLGPATGRDPDELRDRIAGLTEFLDPDFRRDLVSTLGDQIAIAADPEVSRSAVAVIEPADEGAMRRLLHRLDGLARAAGAYRGPAAEAPGITTYRLTAGEGPGPSYLVSGNRLLLGVSAGSLASLADRRRRPAGSPGSPGPLEADPAAHVVLAVDTDLALGWLRRMTPTRDEASAEAWSSRLAQLLPAATGSLPRTTASFLVTREGFSAEWSGPASPTLLTALTLISPGPPAADDGSDDLPPPPENPAP